MRARVLVWSWLLPMYSCATGFVWDVLCIGVDIHKAHSLRCGAFCWMRINNDPILFRAGLRYECHVHACRNRSSLCRRTFLIRPRALLGRLCCSCRLCALWDCLQNEAGPDVGTSAHISSGMVTMLRIRIEKPAVAMFSDSL